ncbi:MAG: DNA-processing protein DprA [Planctomycetota bacterium]|nr:DNA-processing protein DprA [Planctomycetota bacterium]
MTTPAEAAGPVLAPHSPAERHARLRLHLSSGVGPVLFRRAIERFGSAADACAASPAAWKQVQGVGDAKSAAIATGLREAQAAADREVERAAALHIRIVHLGDPDYPALLASLPDSPGVLFVRGDLRPATDDRYPVAIVGSRDCTHYGLEQARRFAGGLAQAGLTVVSGGARGIDGAAHLGALHAGGRTIVVLGCGLAHTYPPEHKDLFDRVAACGAIVSELPIDTPPAAENFPARNRIISGLSLGVLVIEAGERSGALITARLAVDEHGREVFALPGRVDSAASRGTLGLLKRGEAAMATEPADVIAALEACAHHVHRGTHAVRFPARETLDTPALFTQTPPAPAPPANPVHAALLAALHEPRTADDVAESVGMDVARVRAELTMLEIQGRVARSGSKFIHRK